MVVGPAVGNPTDARFGKRDNTPMWISFPYRPQSSSASRLKGYLSGDFYIALEYCCCFTRRRISASASSRRRRRFERSKRSRTSRLAFSRACAGIGSRIALQSHAVAGFKQRRGSQISRQNVAPRKGCQRKGILQNLQMLKSINALVIKGRSTTALTFLNLTSTRARPFSGLSKSREGSSAPRRVN